MGAAVNSVLGDVGLGSLAGPSTGGMSDSGAAAQSAQRGFIGDYNNLTPNQAPTMDATSMNAAQMQAANASPAAAIQAAQMGAAKSGAAAVDASGLQPFTAAQQGLAASLQNTINNPNASSVAQLQQQQAFSQQMAQQQGLAAAMGRGGNAALASRTAMNNVGGLGAQQAAGSALQRAAETQAAQGQLGTVLQQGAGNALQIAGQNAQNQQATNIANQAAAMAAASQNAQQQQAAAQFNAGNQQTVNLANQASQNAAAAQNASQRQAANSQNSSQAQAANAANQAAQLTNTGQYITQQANLGNLANTANSNQTTAATAQYNAANQNAQNTGNFISGVAGAAATMSDERVKDKVDNVDPALMQDFYAHAVPQSWSYKGRPDHAQIGPMAQDLEKSAVGRTMVRQTPQGLKAIDHSAAITALLASVGDMGRRIQAIEGKKAA